MPEVPKAPEASVTPPKKPKDLVSAFSRNQLIEMCAARNLVKSGTKEMLAERLVQDSIGK